MYSFLTPLAFTDYVEAHWFDMPKFWAAAAKVLKPGGTVAIWTVFRQPGRLEYFSGSYCLPTERV